MVASTVYRKLLGSGSPKTGQKKQKFSTRRLSSHEFPDKSKVLKSFFALESFHCFWNTKRNNFFLEMPFLIFSSSISHFSSRVDPVYNWNGFPSVHHSINWNQHFMRVNVNQPQNILLVFHKNLKICLICFCESFSLWLLHTYDTFNLWTSKWHSSVNRTFPSFLLSVLILSIFVKSFLAFLSFFLSFFLTSLAAFLQLNRLKVASSFQMSFKSKLFFSRFLLLVLMSLASPPFKFFFKVKLLSLHFSPNIYVLLRHMYLLCIQLLVLINTTNLGVIPLWLIKCTLYIKL